MAVTVRNILLFAFCTGSLAAYSPEGITLVSSDESPFVHGGDKYVAGIRVDIPRASTEPKHLPVTTEFFVGQGRGVGDVPDSVVTPASGKFTIGIPVVPGTTAVSSGPDKVVERVEKSMIAKLHAWLTGHIPEPAASHLPEPQASDLISGLPSPFEPDIVMDAMMNRSWSEDDFLRGYLMGSVLLAMTDFEEVDVKVSDAGCGYCAGNETEAFQSKVVAEFDIFCGDHVQIRFFCQNFMDMKRITVSTLLKKVDVDPIKLGVLRCSAAGGPCHPNNPSTKQMNHFMHAMGRFVHKRLKDSRGPHSLVVDNLVSLAMRKSMPPKLETEASSCSACMNLGVDLYKAAVFQILQSTCANARCHRIQAACKFGREHPFLMDLAVTRKLELWDKVVAECTLSNHCPALKEGPLGPSKPSILSTTAFPPLHKMHQGGVEWYWRVLTMGFTRWRVDSSSLSTSASSSVNEESLRDIAAESALEEVISIFRGW